VEKGGGKLEVAEPGWVMLRDETPRGFIEQRRREEEKKKRKVDGTEGEYC